MDGHLLSLVVWPKCVVKFVNFQENMSDSYDQNPAEATSRDWALDRTAKLNKCRWISTFIAR